MDIERALEIIRANPAGVLATVRPDSSPHQSVVSAAVIGDVLWFSLTESRVKTRNIDHDPRVSFLAGLGPWAAVEGRGELLRGPDVLEKLRTYYRTLRGEHPDWDDYDRAMVRDKRLLLQLKPARAYGFDPPPG